MTKTFKEYDIITWRKSLRAEA